MIEFQISPSFPVGNFAVKDVENDGKVSSGIVLTPEDRIARLFVVTQRYLDASYITSKDLSPGGLYVDKYEPISIPIVSKIGNEVAASFRLIPNLADVGLPINNEREIIIEPEWQEKIKDIPFELSQLAKSGKFAKDPRPTLAVIKTYMGIADRINVHQSAAVIDEGVIRLLNGPYLGFNLPKIGPTVDYLGSPSTPVFIDIDDVRENSRSNGHSDLADFLSGKSVKGFEWYKGP